MRVLPFVLLLAILGLPLTSQAADDAAEASTAGNGVQALPDADLAYTDSQVEPLPDVPSEMDDLPDTATEKFAMPIEKLKTKSKTEKKSDKKDKKTARSKPAPKPEPEVVPEISSAPVIHGGAQRIGGAPVAPDLQRFQFLPLPAKGADPNVMPLLWPVLASHSLEGDHTGMLRRIVIVVHDDHRDADETLRQAKILAGPGASGRLANIMIVAPLFSMMADRARFKPMLTDGVKHVAAWSATEWWQGGETAAADNDGRRVSSMTAMDLLLLILTDKRRFPELRQLVVAGYGRGADFVHRYALFSRAQDVLSETNLKPHYVLFAPLSYVYLTDNRPDGQGVFATPKNVKTCPGWQDYPYGLEQPNVYTRLTAGNVARQNYVSRQVTTLVGGEDNDVGDKNCAALLQGRNVKERAENFDAFLKSGFGEVATQKLLLLPSVANDPMALVTSSCGASLLFADGTCLRAQ